VTETLIDADAVGRRFGEVWALRGVTLHVNAGETVALIGPNGAGKTTLLDILAGARDLSEGVIHGAGADAGFVPQRAALWRRLTTRENLELFARLRRLADAQALTSALLAASGLIEVADRTVNQLSVGQAQRVNVAAGLLGNPRVVLLDEPTASLDPRQRRLLWRLLRDVTARGGAVVFTTQNVEEVALHANRLVALVEGRAVFSGSVDEFRRRAGSDADEGFEDAFVRFLDVVDSA
jgi:ABC-2 type transport system ATP-binding protein